MTVLQALAAHYDRLLARDREMPEYGYSREAVSFCIVLSPEGKPVDVMDVRDTSGKAPRPSRRVVPRPPPDRTGTKVVANYLWDKTPYALGVTRHPDTRELTFVQRGEHETFKSMHRTLLAGTTDQGLQAVLAFLDLWDPAVYEDLPCANDMLAENVVFRLDGEMGFIHERAAARLVWQNHLASQADAEGFCLVTGDRAPVRRLHPKIKGVRGAQSAGASIVSFNLDAFESFGRKQGDNAPVSERAVFAYTTALNTLLAPNSRQRIRIGDSTVVFWAEVPAAEDLMLACFEVPPDDEGESGVVRDMLEKVARGMPVSDASPEVDENTRYYLLGLAPNAARLSVRFWHEDNIGTLVRRVAEHWGDLRIVPARRQRPPTVRDVANETAVVVSRPDGRWQKRYDTVPPIVAGGVLRAVITGQRYPAMLASTIIMRLRSDGHISELRIAVLKAWVVRELRIRQQLPKEDYLVSLDSTSGNVAYNLGRLFAAFAYAERSLADRNATIRDKYMGAASATPRRVFPVLLRGYENNRAGLAKAKEKRGAGIVADRAIGEIMDLLPGRDELPTSLPLEDQSRFFIGYYHQERAFYSKRRATTDPHEHQPEEEEEQA